MGRFQYSDAEMGLNKVLKMDLDESEALLKDSELLKVIRRFGNWMKLTGNFLKGQAL